MTWHGKGTSPIALVSQPARVSDIAPYHDQLLFGLVALAVLRLWILPLSSSLWLDETVTYWSAYKGIGAAITRSQFFQGQQVVYSLIAALAMRVGGASEIALRLPSVIAAALTAWLLFLLGKELFDREAGIFAVLVYTSFPVVAKEAAANARPYAIGMLLVVAAMLQLVRWMRSGRLRNMAAFVVLSAAVPYLHYLFAVMYLVFFLYCAYVRWSREAPVSRQRLGIAAILILLLILPLLWNALHAKRINAEASFAQTPETIQLFSSLLNPILGVSLLFGLLVGVLVFGGCRATLAGLSRSTWLLLVGGLTIPVFVLYLVARLTPFETFVPRYFLTAVPALALLIGWIVRSMEPARARIIVGTAIVLVSIISFGKIPVNQLASLQGEDWRSAAALVRVAGISQNTPVLIRVGLIESAKIRWDINIDHDSPLLSPISKYPVPGRVVLVPYGFDPEAVKYLEDVYSQVLMPVDTFVLIARNGAMVPWLRGWCLGHGFTALKMGNPEGITVLLFRRQRPGAVPEISLHSACRLCAKPAGSKTSTRQARKFGVSEIPAGKPRSPETQS